MEVSFKYEVGANVYIKQELRFWHETYGGLEKVGKERGYQSMGELAAQERRPHTIRIIERQMQQCYGGVQLHYAVRAGATLLLITEPELTTDFFDPEVVADNPSQPAR